MRDTIKKKKYSKTVSIENVTLTVHTKTASKNYLGIRLNG